ncbi:MAG: bifunctional demethylmenaquinone methyltransferase/2-methoxy-6-polyprenyl-1,4-benzoquinol methylase UbiE, partial [Planctomycetota bacterium]
HAHDDKARRVQSMFAAIAGRYDLNNRVHSFWRDQAWRRKAVRLARVGPEDDVLDVACGTGDLTEAFASAGPRTIVGLDFVPEMLTLARRKVAARRQRRPGTSTPTYIEGDATALPFDDASHDVVSIAFGLRNVDRPAAALAEFARVLRPGGRLIVLEFSEPRSRLMRTMNRFYSGRIMPFTATLLAGDRSGAYHYLPKSISTFLDPRALAEHVREAGFEVITQVPLTFGVCTCTVATRPAAQSNGSDQ